MCSGIRARYPTARSGCLAEGATLTPPVNAAPDPGVVLDFVPTGRSYEDAIDAVGCVENQRIAEQYIGLSESFEGRNNCIIEHWLDAEMFSHGHRPPVRLPLRR